MHYASLVRRMKRVYPFLAATKIECLHGYGQTKYSPDSDSIVLYFDSLLDFSKTKRFIRRFGRAKCFERVVTLVLLHEITHVYQEKTMDKQVLLREKLSIDDSGAHDKSWLEKDADAFAKKEIGRWTSKS